jgi:hypothetical protein
VDTPDVFIVTAFNDDRYPVLTKKITDLSAYMLNHVVDPILNLNCLLVLPNPELIE